MTTNAPSVAVMKLSKSEYIELADTFRDKAQQEHADARAWRNRALLAESSLATLRAAYEPSHRPPAPLTDAAGNHEPTLPTTPAEGE